MNKTQILTISEGAAGMKSQIEGLANLIGYPYKNIDLKISFLFKYLPVQMIPSSTMIINNLEDFKIETPTILISCGKKSVKASIALKKKYKNIFNIHIQNPKSSYNYFDLIIAPKHDGLNLVNCINTTFAIHNIKFKKKNNLNGKLLINFILGGKNKNFKFDKYVQENIHHEINLLSKKYFVRIIPSRRTPNSLIEKFQNEKINNTKLYTNTNDPIKYGNFLCNALANIVTWESISMISECVYSGVGTFIYAFEKGRLPKKYENFHKNLIENKFIKKYSIDFKPFNTTIDEDLSELKNKILNKINESPTFRT